jgi:hypothetical protein
MELLQSSLLSSEWGPEDLVLFFYLRNCVADHKTDPSAFKKVIGNGKDDKGGNTVGAEMRDL